MYILLYLKWISNKDLLDIILPSGVWQSGWEGSLRGLGACRCGAEPLCCPPGTVTTLLIGGAPVQKKVYQKTSIQLDMAHH